MVDNPENYFSRFDYRFVKSIKYVNNKGEYKGRGRIYETESIPPRYAISVIYTGNYIDIKEAEKVSDKDYIYGQFLSIEDAEKRIVKIFDTWD